MQLAGVRHTKCQYVLIISKEWKGNKTGSYSFLKAQLGKSVRPSLKAAASFTDLGILLDQIKTMICD